MGKKNEFYRRQLPNGLTVLFEKRKLPVINTVLGYRYGGGYEPAAWKGIAHYIEHCLFQGTEEKDSKQISELIEGKGGIINAFTADEVTAYWNKMPSKYLGISIGILAEMVSKAAFKPEKMEKERQVILEEAKMEKDTPDQYVTERLRAYLFKGAFSMALIGTEQTISKFSREAILKFFPHSYSNPVLSVVGNADFNDILEFAKAIPAKKTPEFHMKPAKQNRSGTETRKEMNQSHLVLGFHTCTARDRQRYALQAFNTVLADGLSSRLFQEIRDKRGMAYTVKGVSEIGSEFGYHYFYAGTEKKNVRTVKEIILKEIKKMQQLDSKDFELCKEQMIGRHEIQQESSTAVSLALLEEELFGNAEEFYAYEDRVNALKLEDVRKFGKLKDYSFLALVPK